MSYLNVQRQNDTHIKCKLFDIRQSSLRLKSIEILKSIEMAKWQNGKMAVKVKFKVRWKLK